jgi:hypothetical protein
MKVFIKKHNSGAGKWIYQGYKLAWESLGYNSYYYDNLEELKEETNFYLMTLDSCINKNNISILNKSKKTILYVQPNYFEMPWGTHPNFVSIMDKNLLPQINNLKNIIKWTFGEKSKYFNDWGDVNTLPLAFDNISYSSIKEKNNYIYDVCFVGGRANNGFDEKYKIMLEIFKEFKKTNFRCGFFIDKNLSHEQEKNILFNSKICLNIHDAYQRKLGLDTNERTFKSLGVNGLLISDNITQIEKLFSQVELVNSPEEYIASCSKFINMLEASVQEIKEYNKNIINKNHTYINRVKTILEQ